MEGEQKKNVTIFFSEFVLEERSKIQLGTYIDSSRSLSVIAFLRDVLLCEELLKRAILNILITQQTHLNTAEFIAQVGFTHKLNSTATDFQSDQYHWQYSGTLELIVNWFQGHDEYRK